MDISCGVSKVPLSSDHSPYLPARKLSHFTEARQASVIVNTFSSLALL